MGDGIRILVVILLSAGRVTSQSGSDKTACAKVGYPEQFKTLSYAKLTANCPRGLFCCYPDGKSHTATCCADCTREVDFNPMLQPEDCLVDLRTWPPLLLTILPALTAFLPVMISVASVVILSVIGRSGKEA